MKLSMKYLAILLLASVGAWGQTPKHCAKGEYLSMDGRCLHDRKGESYPSGDGCNTSTCMDSACRFGASTAMACIHGDDPAIVPAQSAPMTTAAPSIELKPKPPKCGKYERIENPMADFCARNSELINKTNRWMCESHASDRCAPIMHEVTEKEWQALMERLKKLEKPLPPCNPNEKTYAVGTCEPGAGKE